MFVGGGGDSLGPGPVVVTPDPGLLEADPGAMTVAAGTFNSAAHQLHSVATATSDASGRLGALWKGKGAEGFRGAASDTNWYSSSAADGLIGASMALATLARSMGAAQALALEAMRLAEHTTEASAALDKAFAASRAAAGPAASAQSASAMAPTPGQQAQAQMLGSDAVRAAALMNEANTMAQSAWRAASAAFDAVTSQSPSVQLAAIGVRVKDFSRSMDSDGSLALVMIASGMAAGEAPGGGGEGDEDDVSPEFFAEEEASDPSLAADLAGEEKMTADGSRMDAAVAADIEGGVPIGWTDNVAVLQASEAAALDPATAGLVAGADPFAGMTPAEYQAKFWDDTAPTDRGKGSWIYPPDNGADLSSSVQVKTFAPGNAFDRFGPAGGTFASPPGTPWADRSLPPTSLVTSDGGSAYHLYKVTGEWATSPPPVVVTETKVAPAFGQPGGGIQYSFEAAPGSKVNMSIQWLLDKGYITEVSR